MHLATIGLGRMGGDMVLRLPRGSRQVVVSGGHAARTT